MRKINFDCMIIIQRQLRKVSSRVAGEKDRGVGRQADAANSRPREAFAGRGATFAEIEERTSVRR